MITIRPYRENDLPRVLALLEKSDSTHRTENSWRGNDMTAVLAFDGKRLVGLVPFEQRRFVLSPKKSIPVLWASGVHVEPEYRNQGIGSRMDQSLRQYFFPSAQAVLVFRLPGARYQAAAQSSGEAADGEGLVSVRLAGEERCAKHV